MDMRAIRDDFPFFSQSGAPVYLDNAATTQKPAKVLERLSGFYRTENANVHRGLYPLADAATRAYAHARRSVTRFVGAESCGEAVFTQNATDALNLAAHILTEARLRPGGNVIVTALEHHSNLLPWMEACRRVGAELRILPLNAQGEPCFERLESLIDARTAAMALTAGSNLTGYLTPLDKVLPLLEAHHVPVVLDATQRVVHEPMNMAALGCDFLCFSAHKLYGPMGVGVMVARGEWLERAVPMRLGGGMVSEMNATGFERLPGAEGLEAGTPNVAGALGLEAAIQYLQNLSAKAIADHENALTDRLTQGLSRIPGVRVLGSDRPRLPIVSFDTEFMQAVDLGQWLGMRGVAVRCGSHCVRLALDSLGATSVVRASLAIYNTAEDVDALLDGVAAARDRQRRGRE